MQQDDRGILTLTFLFLHIRHPPRDFVWLTRVRCLRVRLGVSDIGVGRKDWALKLGELVPEDLHFGDSIL
jgi:hypothetical protein